MSDILMHGNVAILPDSATIFEKVLSSSDPGYNPRDSFYDRFSSSNPYVENPVFHGEWIVGDDIVIPDGPDNLFPQRWKMLIDQDSIMPGILKQKVDLLMSGGLKIFVQRAEGDKVISSEILDNRISDWLDNQGIEDYILAQAVDWVYLERIASLIIPNRASQIPRFSDAAGIARVKRIPVHDVRMVKKLPFENEIRKYYVSDWSNLHTEAIPYPAWNRERPFAGTSLYYSLMPSFCSDYYGRPSTIGAANYLSLKTILLNNTKDQIINAPFRYHIESPQEWWDDVKKSNQWNDAQLKEFETEMLQSIDSFLRSDSGRNAAKRFHTRYKLSESGTEKLGWKITVLEDKSGDRTKSNFEVFEKINEHAIAAASLDPAISNIQVQGKLSSGLDKLTAFNIHILINTPTPRKKILAAMNEAIRINFWKNDFRPFIGFKDLQLSTVNKASSDSDSNPSL